MIPRVLKMTPDCPKMAQRRKMDPRRPEDGPRWPKDGPKMAPRWPQDGPKTAPRRPQDGSKSHLIATFSCLIFAFLEVTCPNPPKTAFGPLWDSPGDPQDLPGTALGRPRGLSRTPLGRLPERFQRLLELS